MTFNGLDEALPAPSPKRIYQSPSLRHYGDIRRLTLASGLGDMNDGGIPMTGKDKS